MSDKEQKQIIIAPQPGMQTEFAKSSETEVFYGGEAGGGKSAVLLIDALYQVPIPGYRAVIFRRTFPDLEGLINLAREWYIPTGATYNDSKHTFRWPNGSTIKFAHMQYVKTIYSHQGQEYDYIGFDELPQFPKLAYVYLFSRLRGSNPNIKRMIRGTGNPDGEFLMWVKNRFFDPMEPLETGYFKTVMDKDVKVTKDTPGSCSRKFIPCVRAENRILMDADPEYENRLDQLPEDKKRALKEGLWTMQDKPDQLIASDWWENAIKGKNEFKDNGKYTIGADYGTYQGVDKSVEFLGVGNKPYRCKCWAKTKTTTFARALAETASSVDRSKVMIGVDSIGPGTGVADSLEEDHNCSSILERCTHKDPKFDAKYIGDIKFDNLRSQMWWCFRIDMENGDIDLSAFMDKPKLQNGEIDEDSDQGYFDEFNTLQEDILMHTYKVNNGHIIVVPKSELKKPERLGRSPDFGDALVIWNWTRRHHYKDGGLVADDDRNPDGYMEESLRERNEDNDDEAYYEEYYEDDGEYED